MKDGVKYARLLGVKIGENCRVFDCKFGSEPFLIEVGNNVTITGVSFLTHDGSTWLFKDDKGRRYLYRKIKIGNNVFIGVNSTLLPGVNIEDDVIVAAGSVVTKSVPKGNIVAGNPAKIIKSFYEYKNMVLSNYYADSEINFLKSYKNRILDIVDQGFKDYCSK
ncbi:MAG: acyltransferase [Flavobacteriales bacterium AspAUS03]